MQQLGSTGGGSRQGGLGAQVGGFDCFSLTSFPPLASLLLYAQLANGGAVRSNWAAKGKGAAEGWENTLSFDVEEVLVCDVCGSFEGRDVESCSSWAAKWREGMLLH